MPVAESVSESDSLADVDRARPENCFAVAEWCGALRRGTGEPRRTAAPGT